MGCREILFVFTSLSKFACIVLSPIFATVTFQSVMKVVEGLDKDSSCTFA